jgi:NAD(P)-dependent dehydrogenase (short-subunit alcohol dehydrogenase family)
MAPASKSVLVTGTSSGIGQATVERLARDGWRVFAGLRDGTAGANGAADSAPAEAPRGAATATAGGAGEVVPLALDVTDADQVSAAVESISSQTGGVLHGVVHNAGIPIGGALEEVEADQLRRIFEVNVIAPVLLTQRLLPLLRRERGRVVIVGSLGGRVAFPFAGPYHATKYALEAIADSLRLELRPQGVGVALIEPGTIQTPIWAKAEEQVEAQRRGLTGESRDLYDERLAAFQGKLRSADSNGDDPAKVADKIAEALEGDGTRYPVGKGAGTLGRLRPLLPDGLFDRAVGTRLG